jgi:RNA polymerase sigma factor (TIGR02999 family)
MCKAAREEVARLLQKEASDRSNADGVIDRLFDLVYEELHAIAVRLMRGERPDHTLRPTALVHEAYLRLVDADQIEWQDRAHFLRIAARAMRRILVDHARKRVALKGGGRLKKITLDDHVGAKEAKTVEILVLDDALTRLGHLDQRLGRVVELRVFAGMKMEEIAHVLLISRRTAYDDWDLAKRWLARELGGEST